MFQKNRFLRQKLRNNTKVPSWVYWTSSAFNLSTVKGHHGLDWGTNLCGPIGQAWAHLPPLPLLEGSASGIRALRFLLNSHLCILFIQPIQIKKKKKNQGPVWILILPSPSNVNKRNPGLISFYVIRSYDTLT